MVLFVSGLNVKNVWVKEATSWIRVPCVKWKMSYLQFVVVFVCSYKMQETQGVR